jgi:hypothetical protein
LVAASVELDGIQYYHQLPMGLLVQYLDTDTLLVEEDLGEVLPQRRLALQPQVMVLWADRAESEGVELVVM